MNCSINDFKQDMEFVSGGDFNQYNTIVRKKFYDDFVNNAVYRNGRRISAGSSEKEIEMCYDHLTSIGSMGKERIPDLRRMECIFILKEMLESSHCANCKNIYVWEKQEKYLKEKIFCPETGYLIILLKRDKTYKFVSAFFIESKAKRKRLIDECRKANE